MKKPIKSAREDREQAIIKSCDLIKRYGEKNLVNLYQFLTDVEQKQQRAAIKWKAISAFSAKFYQDLLKSGYLLQEKLGRFNRKGELVGHYCPKTEACRIYPSPLFHSEFGHQSTKLS